MFKKSKESKSIEKEIVGNISFTYGRIQWQ